VRSRVELRWGGCWEVGREVIVGSRKLLGNVAETSGWLRFGGSIHVWEEFQ
jgi:hypothetical protein